MVTMPGAIRPARPATVLLAAIACFVAAAVCGAGVLVGIILIVISIVGSLPLAVVLFVFFVAVCVAAGILYVLGGVGLLRGRRGWYLTVLVLHCLTIVVGVAAFLFGGRSGWELAWAVLGATGYALMGPPPTRAWCEGRPS